MKRLSLAVVLALLVISGFTVSPVLGANTLNTDKAFAKPENPGQHNKKLVVCVVDAEGMALVGAAISIPGVGDFVTGPDGCVNTQYVTFGTVDVMVAMDGFEPWSDTINYQGDKLWVTLTAEPAPVPLVFCAVDAEGNPLAGISFWGGFGNDVPPTGSDGCATTNFYGPAGQMSVNADGDGYQLYSVLHTWDGVNPITVTMTADPVAVPLVLCAIDPNGNPISGISFWGGYGNDVPATGSDGCATTNYFGPAGGMSVNADGYGYLLYSQYHVWDGSTPVIVTMTPAMVLCTVDAEGAPVAGASVWGGFGTYVTGDDGCVETTHIIPGGFSFAADAYGYILYNVYHVWDGSNPVTATLTRAMIVCTVDEAGNPIAGASVWGGFGSYVTGVDGCVETTHIYPGGFSLAADAEGYQVYNVFHTWDGLTPEVATLVAD